MDGSSDPYAHLRRTQAEMWPGATRVALRGRDWYRDGGPDRLNGGGEE